MRVNTVCAVTAFLMFGAAAEAASISFFTDPFAGTTALSTPGRQIIGNELFVTFSVASDVFVLEPSVFGVDPIVFANGLIGNIPTTGENVVVLQTTDDDANTGTPFGAGNAANLIADRITTSGPGFFIYFNSGLNLPRLVYSTDLGDPTADLKILARITNLSGNTASLATFTAANFSTVPEPSAFVMVTGGGALLAFSMLRRKRNQH